MLIQYSMFVRAGLKRLSGSSFLCRKRIPSRHYKTAARAENEPSWDKISTDELEDWKQQGPPTPLLDTVNFPVHIKNFNGRQLQQLCKELRAGIILQDD